MSNPDSERRPGQIILGWWSTELGARTTGAQKGLSARLRRGDDVTVLCERPVHDLAHHLGLRDGARIARLARVLAHVRDHGPRSLPRRLGTGDPPIMSQLRFERLVRSEGEELEAALRRALEMAGHAANVAHLGESVLLWSDAIRTRWCFDYYGAEPPKTALSKESAQ
ncbi:type I-E CRISPR-associated protein Cse2/CasB [Nioella nitratireducens]|uniref:type I-E CRISPR-associated protein Cse2/CasB n=1 Tax=Nioella nitratireducens TaxID=1287720 RepID=UPI0008FD66AD|nr:type I-E CRISPR-associated protein Cse2/CasB [Nioella nitratireducens]